MNAIREFYKDSENKLWLPKDVRWRFFKMQLQSGAYMHLRDQIRNTETLRNHLVKLAPRHVWVSVSLFQSPQNVGRKTDEKSRNLIMGTTFAVESDYGHLEYARRNALRLLDYLEKRTGKAVSQTLFSGKRGIHCWPDYTVMSDSEAQLTNYRKQFAKELQAAGIRFDKPVFLDCRRVMRVCGSVNGSTGYICQPLTREELENRDWLSKIPRIHVPVIPTITAPKITRDPAKKPKDYVLTSVVGTKRQIVSLRYSTYKPNELRGLGARFNIRDWCVVRGKWIWALSSKSCDFPWIKKVIRASSADEDFKELIYRLGYGFFETGTTHLAQLKINPLSTHSDNGPFSMAHNQLLRGMGFILPDRNEIGMAEVVGRTILG